MDWHTRRGITRTDNLLMLLTIHDIRQREDFDCGSAAVDSLCAFHGVRQRGPVKLANRIDGMAPDTVAAVLRALGFRVLSGPMVGGISDLQHFTRAGLPVLCPITVAAGGHWVIVRGVERARVYYQCPTNGPVSMSAAKWMDGWRDTSASGHEFDRWGIVAAK